MDLSNAARRLTGLRRHAAVLSLADQLVSSMSNFGLGVLVGRAGGAGALGAFGVAYLIWIAAFGLSRAMVSEPLTVTEYGKGSADAVRSGVAATLVLAFAGAGLLAVVSLGSLALGFESGAVLALTPWMPFLLVQDYWRTSHFRRGEPGRALANDLVFIVVQAGCSVGLLVAGIHSVEGFVAAWGIGAASGALLGLRIFGVSLSCRGGLALLRRLRGRNSWYIAEFATAFTADQAYLLLLPLFLDTPTFGVYRAGASLIGPVVVIFLAVGNVGLPGSVRHLRVGGVGGLRRYASTFTLYTVTLTIGYCSSVAMFAPQLIELIYGEKFAGAPDITQMVAMQYAIFSFGLTSGVALKAVGLVRQIWTVRLAGAVVSLTGVVIFVRIGGVMGAAAAGIAAATVYSAGLTLCFWRYLRNVRYPVDDDIVTGR